MADDFELYLEGILEAPRGPRDVFHHRQYVAPYKNSPSLEVFPCAGPPRFDYGHRKDMTGFPGTPVPDALPPGPPPPPPGQQLPPPPPGMQVCRGAMTPAMPGTPLGMPMTVPPGAVPGPMLPPAERRGDGDRRQDSNVDVRRRRERLLRFGLGLVGRPPDLQLGFSYRWNSCGTCNVLPLSIPTTPPARNYGTPSWEWKSKCSWKPSVRVMNSSSM